MPRDDHPTMPFVPVPDSERTQIMPRKSVPSIGRAPAAPGPGLPPLASVAPAPAPVSMPAPPPRPVPPPPVPAASPVPPKPPAARAPDDADETIVRRASSLDFELPDPAQAAAARTLPGHTLSGLGEKMPAGGGTDAPVRQVGRYLVRSRVGRGGMATVYKAHDPQIGRDVAIKFLHASLAEDEDCKMRFLREARAAGGLSHPNIVVVHDVGEIEGRPYMAMELIDGMPLDDIVDKGGALPLRDAVVMGVQLARALGYAHERGIVHRDIKPGNIMVLKDQKSIKVTDFGIAHIDDGAGQRTQVGALLGTPQYMSPEQARGEKLDGRSDLFSAGVVLYQMVTGSRPFRGDSPVVTIAKIVNDPHPPVTQARPDAPASLRRVIDRCLAKNAAQRFQTGNELAEALLKVLAEMDEAVRAKDKPRIVPLRIKWALAMAVIVAVVMGITATIITQRQYAALMGQATDYGESLARFIARQNAAAALAEEWEVVDVAVQDMMKTGSFERIVVIDPVGTVRASSQTALVGQPYQAAGRLGANKITRYQANGESVLAFEAPITFQDKNVGRIALGIPEGPLTAVARLSITLMTVLALVTVLAVAVAMYYLGDRFAKPIRLLSESLGEIGKGNLGYRIAEQRKDEFGQLFADFDAMAQGLEQRIGGGSASKGAPPRSGLETPRPQAAKPGAGPGGRSG
jgi:serine/threonine protein kinase/HAMP domain-containing protein